MDILPTGHFAKGTFCQLDVLTIRHFTNLPFFNLPLEVKLPLNHLLVEAAEMLSYEKIVVSVVVWRNGI